jgi:HSP20 family protein
MNRPDRKGDMEEIFEILVTSYGRRGGAVPTEDDLCWRPATDAYETDDGFVVQIELAGMDPARIEVLTDGQSLLVRGIRQDISEPGKKHFHKMEIDVGPFARRVPLSAGVNPESAQARYRGGFLYVNFTKGKPSKGERRTIAVDCQ